MRGWMPLVVLMTGCMEYGIVDPNGDEPEGFTTGIDDGRSDDGTTTERENQEPNLDDDDEGSSSSCGGSSGSNGGSSSSGGSSCSSGANGSTPRAPQKGELVIHELMIDPSAVLDADGEWVELYNNTNDVLDLAYHRLADDNKDDSTIKSVYPGSLEVEPGDYLVICANEDISTMAVRTATAPSPTKRGAVVLRCPTQGTRSSCSHRMEQRSIPSATASTLPWRVSPWGWPTTPSAPLRTTQRTTGATRSA